MKKALKWLVAPVLLLVAVIAQATPITDNAMNLYKSGWYPNNHKGKLLTCPQACEAWVGAAAEHEISMGLRSKVTHVCKLGDKERFLYGNQFDGTPVCYATDMSGKPQKSKQFFCLCVTPAK